MRTPGQEGPGARTLLVHSGHRGYTVRPGTKKVASGRFWITIVHYGGYDICEGTDEFINTCINDTHRLYSRNGRLYCHIPGGTIQTFAYKRRPKLT